MAKDPHYVAFQSACSFRDDDLADHLESWNETLDSDDRVPLATLRRAAVKPYMYQRYIQSGGEPEDRDAYITWILSEGLESQARPKTAVPLDAKMRGVPAWVRERLAELECEAAEATKIVAMFTADDGPVSVEPMGHHVERRAFRLPNWRYRFAIGEHRDEYLEVRVLPDGHGIQVRSGMIGLMVQPRVSNEIEIRVER